MKFLQRYKFKACYDIENHILIRKKIIIRHCLNTEVESVAPLCPGDQLPPSCGGHPVILAEGVVHCLLYLLLVVVDVD